MSEQGWLRWEELDLLWRVLIAMALGGVLGWEREAADKPAGLRTHMMVAGSAALLVALGETLVARAAAMGQPSVVRADPIRLVEAVMTGIGFLGAGTILRHGTKGVEGLTTAASILFTAGLGVAVALELWVLSVSLTLSAVVVLHLMGRVSRRISPSEPPRNDRHKAASS
jgi:putative Mg2+ transporter-C (MgtC) family protein